jgi:hypothetical protein
MWKFIWGYFLNTSKVNRSHVKMTYPHETTVSHIRFPRTAQLLHWVCAFPSVRLTSSAVIRIVTALFWTTYIKFSNEFFILVLRTTICEYFIPTASAHQTQLWLKIRELYPSVSRNVETRHVWVKPLGIRHRLRTQLRIRITHTGSLFRAATL